MASKLTPGHQVVHRELVDLVRRHERLLPGARVAIKENANGEIVLAIIVPVQALRN